MKIFYSDTHRSHNPSFEVFDGGVRVPNFESPERAIRILDAVRQTDWVEILSPSDFGLDPILAVHAADYVNFLASAWKDWQASNVEFPNIDANSALLPATFPPLNWHHKPESLLGRAGYYMMDLSAPIVKGTFIGALSSVNCALSTSAAVSAGDRAAFAICRPPGHHAGKANCGGYCYLNNAAITAHWLSSRGPTVLLDIDYHAGNGTQEIFYSRPDVLTLSIHADPNFEYPYFNGYADERGSGAGEGYHWNFPLPAGTEDNDYLIVLGQALDLIRDFNPSFLVVSIGMDIHESDALGKFKVTRAGILEIGKGISGLNIPTAIIMEGGYNNEYLGENVVTFLSSFK